MGTVLVLEIIVVRMDPVINLKLLKKRSKLNGFDEESARFVLQFFITMDLLGFELPPSAGIESRSLCETPTWFWVGGARVADRFLVPSCRRANKIFTKPVPLFYRSCLLRYVLSIHSLGTSQRIIRMIHFLSLIIIHHQRKNRTSLLSTCSHYYYYYFYCSIK